MSLEDLKHRIRIKETQDVFGQDTIKVTLTIEETSICELRYRKECVEGMLKRLYRQLLELTKEEPPQQYPTIYSEFSVLDSDTSMSPYQPRDRSEPAKSSLASILDVPIQ